MSTIGAEFCLRKISSMFDKRYFNGRLRRLKPLLTGCWEAVSAAVGVCAHIKIRDGFGKLVLFQTFAQMFSKNSNLIKPKID